MAREKPNAKMGISSDARRRVSDRERYSVGDLLARAIFARDIVRWSEFIVYLRQETNCPTSGMLSLTGFIGRDAPFLGTFGLIDPAAVKEVIDECGGYCHLESRAHNVTTDSRKPTVRQRLARNRRYIGRLQRTGWINAERADLNKVLAVEVPLASDRDYIRRLILSSGLGDRGRFDRNIFTGFVEAERFSELCREETDFLCILGKEMQDSVEQAAIEEEAEVVRAQKQPEPPVVPVEVVREVPVPSCTEPEPKEPDPPVPSREEEVITVTPKGRRKQPKRVLPMPSKEQDLETYLNALPVRDRERLVYTCFAIEMDRIADTRTFVTLLDMHDAVVRERDGLRKSVAESERDLEEAKARLGEAETTLIGLRAAIRRLKEKKS